MVRQSKIVRKANEVPPSEIQDSCVGPELNQNVFGLEYLVCLNGDMNEQERKDVWNIWLANMLDLISGSSMGYDPKGKHDELFHSASRFIRVFQSSSCGSDTECPRRLVAFAIFRFEYEDKENLLYCYELQVHSDAMGAGIGRQLMALLETVGTTYHMDKVMLTVLKENQKAMSFYTKCGFHTDASSPSLFGHDVDYEILSSWAQASNRPQRDVSFLVIKSIALVSHPSSMPTYNEPSGWLFGEKPPAPGQKRVKEGWENAWIFGMFGTMAFGSVLLYYKPDTSVQTWALKEAKERMEARGEKYQYESSESSTTTSSS